MNLCRLRVISANTQTSLSGGYAWDVGGNMRGIYFALNNSGEIVHNGDYFRFDCYQFKIGGGPRFNIYTETRYRGQWIPWASYNYAVGAGQLVGQLPGGWFHNVQYFGISVGGNMDQSWAYLYGSQANKFTYDYPNASYINNGFYTYVSSYGVPRAWIRPGSV